LRKGGERGKGKVESAAIWIRPNDTKGMRGGENVVNVKSMADVLLAKLTDDELDLLATILDSGAYSLLYNHLCASGRIPGLVGLSKETKQEVK
jgi:hypothetical protein